MKSRILILAAAVLTVGMSASCEDSHNQPQPTPVETEYVEIGGFRWAAKNLGATTIAGSLATCAGDYYQWGSINTLYTSIPWGDWSGKGDIAITSWKTGKEKGYLPANREYVASENLSYLNDVVSQKLGDGWRMPTSQEFRNLYGACGGDNFSIAPAELSTSAPGKGIYWLAADQTFIQAYTGVAGLLFCDGKNRLFFPAAGKTYGTSLGVKSDGYYWSSNVVNADDAYGLTFSRQIIIPQDNNHSRYNGFPVRPVKP